MSDLAWVGLCRHFVEGAVALMVIGYRKALYSVVWWDKQFGLLQTVYWELCQDYSIHWPCEEIDNGLQSSAGPWNSLGCVLKEGWWMNAWV